MDSDFTLFLQILVFYAILSYGIFPIAGYYMTNKNYDFAGYGMIVGSLISIVLWYMYGKQMIKDKQTIN